MQLNLTIQPMPRLALCVTILAIAASGCMPGGSDSDSAAISHERFTKVVLDEGLFEPMELDLLDDGRIIFVQRRGEVLIHDPTIRQTEQIAQFKLFMKFEEGLLGVAVDPNYSENNWVYFTYSASDVSVIRVVRFTLMGSKLDMDSEQILLEIPVQREECCHVGGSLEFGPEGNLYISVGDNTNPFFSDGYAPIDERAGRHAWDAQASSGNTQDLRGKILRITPEPDGSYSIPDDNLFPEDGSQGRPEIYVMGNRNPFRIAIDPHTGYLYWGEVGPDAGKADSTRGPRGHDEVNQARAAGNFGWPYFVGDNKAYRHYDFDAETSGAAFTKTGPVNDSPNNTGAQVLPPAQPAFIWYPYGPSEEFPELHEGGRNAMAGPVYHYGDYAASDRKFPRYYDGKLFIYDWVRDWIVAVLMDQNGDYVAMERFMPQETFSAPMDMVFGKDGALYLLEYGKSWYTQNDDARLVRIDYAVHNRGPLADIAADKPIGAAPLTVTLSGALSRDPDGDEITYGWEAEGGQTASGPEAVFSYDEAGVYRVRLTVTDSQGLTGSDSIDILVGNDIPDVVIRVSGNRSFYWDNSHIAYTVAVTDHEDGAIGDGIDASSVAVTLDYVAQGHDLTLQARGHQEALEHATELVGKVLMERANCQACHLEKGSSVGPSFVAIAAKYPADATTKAYLSDKVINGGGGVWGEQAMAAHTHLAPGNVGLMINYILASADTTATARSLPVEGEAATRGPAHSDEQGRYVLAAAYTDRGASGMPRLTGRDVLELRHARIQAEHFDLGAGAQYFAMPADTLQDLPAMDVVVGPDSSHMRLRDIDLTGIRSITAGIVSRTDMTTGGSIDIRLDAPDGESVGSFVVPASAEGYNTFEANLSDALHGRHDLHLVFDGAGEEARPVCAIDWIFVQQ